MSIEKIIGTKQKLTFRRIRPVFETVAVHEDISRYLSPGNRFTSPAQMYQAFSYLTDESKEYFLAVHLDGKNRVNCMEVVSIGSLNQSIVHPREVFKTSLLSSAAAIILIHNHPTGDPTPSREDIEITKRLKEVGDIIGIKVLDHIIVGDSDYCSFVEKGLM